MKVKIQFFTARFNLNSLLFINLQGFEYHVKFEHNMWDYIFFLIPLRTTKENDYTTLEMFVANKVYME